MEMLEVVSSKGVEGLDWEEEVRRTKKKKETTNNNAAKNNNETPMPSDQEDSAALKQLADKSSDNKAKKKHGLTEQDMLRESYKGSLFLALEYVSHDLTGLLDMAYKFTDVQAKSLMHQLLDVLHYMHERKFVHRDLKSSNLLITDRFQVKLADFGLARSLEDVNHSHFHTTSSYNASLQGPEYTNKVITLWYRPPELLLGETRYGTAVDLWSAGCIFAEILLGRPIFTGKTEMDQLSLIFDLLGTPTSSSWENFHELKLIRTGEVSFDKRKKARLRDKYGSKIQPLAALNLLEKLLELDPKKRISARAALVHRYFRVEPLVPSDPSELGSIDLGDSNCGYHEFQTKQRRREAKAIAKAAEDEAKRQGQDVELQKEAFDTAYRAHLQRGAEKDAAARKQKEVLERHRKELELNDEELQLEMSMFGGQREVERQREGLEMMMMMNHSRQGDRLLMMQHPSHSQRMNPSQGNSQRQGWQNDASLWNHPGNPQRHQYDRNWKDSSSQQHPVGDSWQQPSYSGPSRDVWRGGDPRHSGRDNRRGGPPGGRGRYGERRENLPPREDGRGGERSGNYGRENGERFAAGSYGERSGGREHGMPPPDGRGKDGGTFAPGQYGDRREYSGHYGERRRENAPFSREDGRRGSNEGRGNFTAGRGGGRFGAGRDRPGHYGEPRRENAAFPREHDRRGGQDHIGHYGEQRHENAPFQRDDGRRGNDGGERFDARRNEDNAHGSQKANSQQSNPDPLLETEISLEAAEDLILRDFGAKSKDQREENLQPHRQGRERHRDGRDRHGGEGERRHRHRDRSDESREHRRHKSHRHSSREHRHSSRHRHRDRSEDAESQGKDSEVTEKARNGDMAPGGEPSGDRSSSARRDGHPDDQRRRSREHHSSSRHRDDRKREGGERERGDHRHHKRSRYDDRHQHRSERRHRNDERYNMPEDGRNAVDKPPNAAREGDDRR